MSEKDKTNAALLVKKIRGDRKRVKVNPDTTDGSTISNAQLSYDSRIANLDVLIAFISTHEEYNPNEGDIQVTSLQTSNQELKNLTQTVNSAGNSLLTARTERNNILYHNSENVIAIARDVKAYLKSLGDPGKPYYKAVVRLKFKDMN